MDELAIRALVVRLSRPHSSGGRVIERAAILASGADCGAVLLWIADHAGEPEAAAATSAAGRGLHGGRMHARESTEQRPPLRYVLPAQVLA